MLPLRKRFFIAVRFPWLFLLAFCLIVFYQCTNSYVNLVTNGGFDLRLNCPTRISQVRLSHGWSSNGSADLFCLCSNTQSPVYAELNFAGSLSPQSGECYAGFIVNQRYKEYVSFALPRKMKRGARYCIRFLYARSIYCAIKTNRLGIYLHPEKLGNAARGQPLHLKTASAAIADRPGTWTALSFTFTCQGGERFITIGSFDNDLTKAVCWPAKENKKPNRVFNYKTSGYYFIENIELTRLRKNETCNSFALPADSFPEPTVPEFSTPVDTIKSQHVFQLRDLNFETNKSTIMAGSFDELNELADFLLRQPELTLSIEGHTDSTGNEQVNQHLSLARASAVANYLAAQGVRSGRLTTWGFGSGKPISDNKTEPGRSLNRRVEFRVSEH